MAEPPIRFTKVQGHNKAVMRDLRSVGFFVVINTTKKDTAQDKWLMT